MLRKFLFSKNAGSIIRGISYLCVFGVAISVFATILVVCIMLGLNDSIHDRTLAVQPYFEMPLEGIENEQEFGQEVKAEIESRYKASVYFAENQDLLIRTIDGLTNGAVGIGYEALEWQWVWNRIKDKNGSREELYLGENEVAIGIDLSRNMAIYEGDELVLFSPESMLLAGIERPKYQRVRVKRVIRTDSPDFDAKAIFYDAFTGFRFLNDSSSRSKRLNIRLFQKEDYLKVKKFLEDKDWKFITWEEKNKSLLFALKMEKYAMSLFLLFTVLIASFSIFTVLSLLISQKRKEIGVLLSLGYSRRQVKQIFTGIGMSLSSLGVFLGGTLAIFTCYALKKYEFFSLPAEIYYDHKIPVHIDWFFIWTILFLSLIVAYAGSILPSSWSVKENIVDLIRDQRSS